MAKFTFPVSVEKLVKVLNTAEGKETLRAFNTDDNVEFAISCMRSGYTNKMYHKVKSEEDRMLNEIMKNDPSIRRAIEEKVKSLGKKTA